MRDRRGRDRRLAADVVAGVAAAVAELDRGLGAAAVDLADQPREPGQEAVVIDADFAPAMAAALFRRRHLDGDQADAAAHPRHVVGDGVVGDEALRIRRARGHRRHDDAVRDLDRDRCARREQDIHGDARGSSSPAKRGRIRVGGHGSPLQRRIDRPHSQYRNLAAVEIDGGAVQPGGARRHHEGDESATSSTLPKRVMPVSRQSARAPCPPARRCARPRHGYAATAARSRPGSDGCN